MSVRNLSILDLAGPEDAIMKYKCFQITEQGLIARVGDLPEIAYLDLRTDKTIGRNFDFGNITDIRNCWVDVVRLKYDLEHDALETTYYTFERLCLVSMFISTNAAIFRKYLTVFRIFKRHRKNFEARRVCLTLIHILYEKNYFDPTLIMDILTSIFRGVNATRCIFFSCDDPCILDFVLRQVWIHFMNVRRFTSVFPFHRINFCPVLSFVFTKKPEYIKVIFNNGFQKRNFIEILQPKHAAISNPVYKAFETQFCFREDGNVIKLTKYLRNHKTLSPRDHSVFELVYIICVYLEDLDNAGPMVESMDIMYRSLPDTFISMNEMRTRIRNLPAVVSYAVTEEVVTTYNKLFPMVTTNMIPRSLKHLSRCSIRNALRSQKYFSLNGYIKRLPLPKKLQRFIALEES